MSHLFDSKNQIKKIVNVIDELIRINADYTPKLKDHLNKLLDKIEQLEQLKAENQQKIESNNDEINTLKAKISQTQQDISRLEENVDEITKERQELLDRIQTAQNELNATKEEIRIKNEELGNRNQRLKELENNIDILTKELNKFDERLKGIETELENNFFKKQNFVQSYENRVNAMKRLIRRNYINSLQYQFIRALQQGSALDLRNIIVAIDMREEQAKKILRKMVEQNGPIEYNEETGTVKLLEEVDFK
ncbi:MAG: hypothetical protein ACFE9T_13375 [Promethearchaeota archaeon]